MLQHLRVAFAASALFAPATPVGATDHVVDLRCVGESEAAHYEIQPNPVVVTAGTDGIVFRTGPYEESAPCAQVTYAPTLEVSIAGLPGAAYLWYYGAEAPPLGPFCEAGPRTYDVWLRGSGGQLFGRLDETGHILVAPQSGAPSTPGPVIGLFAEPEALHCALPGGIGAHRTYVCARPGSAGGVVIGADFRVEGFPAGVNARAVFSSGYLLREGDPLGAGAQLGGGALLRMDCGILPAEVFVLCEIHYDVVVPLAPTVVQIATRQLPGHTSPHLFRCSNQAIAEECAAAGGATLGGTIEACAVSVRAATWSSVRRLYR